jgi:homogentisate 1,2-dioxygenase
MPQYVRGSAARQAHVALPPGTVEEEHGRGGFYGRASHLYRRNPPTAWTAIEGPLRPRAYDLLALTASGPLPEVVLANTDVEIGVWRIEAAPTAFLRDADGDLALFVHHGTGRIESDYGSLDYRTGDYVVLPRGTTFRPSPDEPTWLLTIATAAEIEPPDRGLLGRHALWDESVTRIPEVEPHDERGDFEVVVRAQGQLTSIHYPFHPLDVVGWKGDLCPFALNVEDLRPVSSHSYHLPPSAHTTLTADGVVVCSFVPRPLETAPDAVKVPFYHRNIDFDEVIFYHHGDFVSRAGITPGMLTWHPQGIHHGPHPKAVERAGQRDFTEEIAVMVDTRRPLHATPSVADIEDDGYWATWQE